MREFASAPTASSGRTSWSTPTSSASSARRASSRRGRRARDRRRAGGALRVPRAARRARARRRDRRATARGAETPSSAANVTLHWGDAMTDRPRRAAPAPTKVVANLPYGIAAGALLRTIEELPSVGRWVAMVQREVGERLAAAPGGGVYGAPSVLAQLACEVRVAARRPAHRLPSGAERRLGARACWRRAASAAEPGAARRSCAGAFAHRRKTLARSLALARVQTAAALARRCGSAAGGASATPRTCAPSASRRRTSRALRWDA